MLWAATASQRSSISETTKVNTPRRSPPSCPLIRREQPHPGFLELQVGGGKHVAEADGVVVLDLALTVPPETDDIDKISVWCENRS